MNKDHCRLSPLALGMALGVLWGGTLLLMGLLVYFFAYGKFFIDAMSNIYKLYTPTLAGTFMGALIAFTDAFVTGVILGWLYNVFSGNSCCRKKIKNKDQE